MPDLNYSDVQRIRMKQRKLRRIERDPKCLEHMPAIRRIPRDKSNLVRGW